MRRNEPSILESLLLGLVRGGQAYQNARLQKRQMDEEDEARRMRAEQFKALQANVAADNQRLAQAQQFQQRTALAGTLDPLAKQYPENLGNIARTQQDILSGTAVPGPRDSPGFQYRPPGGGLPPPTVGGFPAQVARQFTPQSLQVGRTADQIDLDRQLRIQDEISKRQKADNEAERQKALELEKLRGANRKSIVELQNEAKQFKSEEDFVRFGLRDFLTQGGDPTRQVEYAEQLRNVYRMGRETPTRFGFPNPAAPAMQGMQPRPPQPNFFPQGTKGQSEIARNQATTDWTKFRTNSLGPAQVKHLTQQTERIRRLLPHEGHRMMAQIRHYGAMDKALAAMTGLRERNYDLNAQEFIWRQGMDGAGLLLRQAEQDLSRARFIRGDDDPEVKALTQQWQETFDKAKMLEKEALTYGSDINKKGTIGAQIMEQAVRDYAAAQELRKRIEGMTQNRSAVPTAPNVQPPPGIQPQMFGPRRGGPPVLPPAGVDMSGAVSIQTKPARKPASSPQEARQRFIRKMLDLGATPQEAEREANRQKWR